MTNRSWFRRWSAVLTGVATPLGSASLATRLWPGRSSSTTKLTAGLATMDTNPSYDTLSLITGAILAAVLATVLWMRARDQGNRTLRWLLSDKDHPIPHERHERLILTRAALSGGISGAVQAIISWLLNHLTS